MPTERGVVYVATGERSTEEARRSVRSLRVLHPGLPVTLFTDRDVLDPEFDDVRTVANARHDWSDKIGPLLETPYERTIFLDADTFVCASLYPMFALLDRFDLAVAHDTVRTDERWAPEAPVSFPELNTGVLVYRKSPAVVALLRDWRPLFDDIRARHGNHPDINDQQAFRALLWERDVRFTVLPPECNLRIWCPNAVGAEAVVTVIHSHDPTIDRIAALVNRSHDARVFLPTIGYVEPKSTVVATPRGDRLVRWLGRLLPMIGRRARRFTDRAS